MQCPSCGLQINQQNLERCPRCGYALTSTTGPYGQGTSPQSGYGYPPQSGDPGGYPPPQQPDNPYGGYGSYGGYGQPAPPSGYGSPPQGPAAPYGQGQYGQPAPPSGYGQPAPPSGYGQPSYGQPAPPSYPMAGGYPPGEYTQPGYSPPPQRKSRTGLIVGIIVVVVIALVACTGGTIFALRSFGQSVLTGVAATETAMSNTTPTVGATPTAARTVIYQNTFASGADGWVNEAGKCIWKSDGYHVVDGYECYAPTGVQTDVDVAVRAQQVKGKTTAPFGLVFALDDQNNDYEFMIDSNSKWALFKCSPDTCDVVVDYTANPAIQGGLHTANQLEVLVQGTHFEFYVNGTKVGTHDDTNYTSGRVGVVAGTSIESVFTNFVVSRP